MAGNLAQWFAGVSLPGSQLGDYLLVGAVPVKRLEGVD
jgi:hypothetical protein